MARKPHNVDPGATLWSAGLGMAAIAVPMWISFEVWASRIVGHTSELVQLVALVAMLVVLVFGALLGMDMMERRGS